MALVPFAAAATREEIEALMQRSQQFTLDSVSETGIELAGYIEKMKAFITKLVDENRQRESALKDLLCKRQTTMATHARTIGQLQTQATNLETAVASWRERAFRAVPNEKILYEIQQIDVRARAAENSCEHRAKAKQQELIDALEKETKQAITKAIQPVIQETEASCKAASEARKQALIAAHKEEVPKVIEEARAYLENAARPIEAYKKDMDWYATFYGPPKTEWQAAKIGREASKIVEPIIKQLKAPFPTKEES